MTESPSQIIRKASLLLGGERRDSEEIGLHKTVSFGGAWHSEEEDEETLLTNPKSRPDRHKTELGRGSWHREEESEEALATRLKIPAQLPPPPGQLTQAGQAGFWPKRGAWSPGPPHFPPLGDTTPCPALFRGDLA